MKSSSNPTPIVLLALCLWVVGCTTVWQGTVTITAVVEKAAKEYASAYNSGLVPPDVHAKVSAAHLAYRKASGVAADALEAWNRDPANHDYTTALEAARTAALGFVDLLAGILSPQEVVKVRARIQQAVEP